jgi:hypothetical protein
MSKYNTFASQDAAAFKENQAYYKLHWLAYNPLSHGNGLLHGIMRQQLLTKIADMLPNDNAKRMALEGLQSKSQLRNGEIWTLFYAMKANADVTDRIFAILLNDYFNITSCMWQNSELSYAEVQDRLNAFGNKRELVDKYYIAPTEIYSSSEVFGIDCINRRGKYSDAATLLAVCMHYANPSVRFECKYESPKWTEAEAVVANKINSICNWLSCDGSVLDRFLGSLFYKKIMANPLVYGDFAHRMVSKAVHENQDVNYQIAEVLSQTLYTPQVIAHVDALMPLQKAIAAYLDVMPEMNLAAIATREIQYPALHELADLLRMGDITKLMPHQRMELLAIVGYYAQVNGYKAKWVSEYKDVPKFKAAFVQKVRCA